MTLVVCVDDDFGMLFNGRRQSKDRLLRKDLLQTTKGSRLWMNNYSASQFEEAERIIVDENFLERTGCNDYCFVENMDITPYILHVTGVIVYRWNRDYPADTFFPVALFKDRWKLCSREEFTGSSHDVITKEVYVL